MSSKKNNHHNQNIVLHIGPHFELNEVKQLNNTNNVDINCCKSSSCKVDFIIEKQYCNKETSSTVRKYSVFHRKGQQE